MEILFESNTETEEEFEFNGEVIINKGSVQIITGNPFALGEASDEADSL
jgi:hypothetical protein